MTATEAVAAAQADAIRAWPSGSPPPAQSRPRPGRDPVNLPMIRTWIEAIGDASPVYTDADAAAASVHRALVAPPAMIQVWTMPGLPRRPR